MMQNKNIYLIDLSQEENEGVEGGVVGGIILGAVNGACIGLAVSLVGSFCNSDWTGEDTSNVVKTCTITGGYLGTYLPL